MRDALAEGRRDAEKGGGGMSLFRRREPPLLLKAAVCFNSPAMTRYAVDWLGKLGGCKPMAILSDDYADVVWQCVAEQADLLLLETDFTEGVEDKDISARCDIAIEVRRLRPECRVYLVCAAGHPEKLPALDKAVELKLIHGYFIGDLTARQMRAWIAETSEAMGRQERRQRDLRKGEQP